MIFITKKNSKCWLLFALLFFLDTFAAYSQNFINTSASLKAEDYNEKIFVVKVFNSSNEVIRVGSAIPFRFSNDTLYVVSAWHLLQNLSDHIDVRLQSINSAKWIYPKIQSYNEKLDVVVLSIPNSTSKLNNLDKHRLRKVTNLNIRDREKLYAVGCLFGECWHKPLEIDYINDVDPYYFRFNSSYIGSGLSGGAVVDSEGGLAGMIINSTYNYGEATYWYDISYNLENWGFKPNFFEKSIVRSNETYLSLLSQMLPLPARNINNKRTFPGFGLGLTYTLFNNLLVYTEIDRYSGICTYATEDRCVEYGLALGFGVRSILSPNDNIKLGFRTILKRERLFAIYDDVSEINPLSGNPEFDIRYISSDSFYNYSSKLKFHLAYEYNVFLNSRIGILGRIGYSGSVFYISGGLFLKAWKENYD